MSEPKTVFGKIIAALLSVFISNWPSFVAKLWKKVPDDLQDKLFIGIEIVERIKTWVDGPVADFIVHAIPGELDDEIREKISDALKKVLAISDNTVSIGRFDLRSAMAHSIASEINQELTGLPFGQSALTTEVAYQNYKK